MQRFALACAVVLSLHLGTVALADPIPNPTIETSSTYRSDVTDVVFASDFPGGRLDDLTETAPGKFELIVRPEVEPINDSAWYAFKVEADRTQQIQVRLTYRGGSHRYEPKISTDRRTWRSAKHLITAITPSRREVTLQLPVGPKPVYVAGQELVDNTDVAKWTRRLAKRDFVRTGDLGASVEGRPIYHLEIGDSDATDSIFILSRQHPPEVTGTIGMQTFVETIAEQTKLATKFRRRFKTIVVPIANPDGVARGYWRTNANGVDLNRDWQHFRQPETRAIRDRIAELQQGDAKTWVFLDFHSTYNEVFYTAPKETKLFPTGFTTDWVKAIDKSVDGFTMLRDDGHNAHRSTSKAWVARELGIHAITYEFGDETDRDRIDQIATKSAEEFMRLLIERKHTAGR